MPVTKKDQETVRKAVKQVATGAGPTVPLPKQKTKLQLKLRGREKMQRKKEADVDPVKKSDRAARRVFGSGDQNVQVKEAKRKIGLLKELIEPLTPSLVQICSDIAHDKTVHAAVRLDAATRLMDRAFGKPKEHVIVEDQGSEGGSDDEVRTMLNRILESVGAPQLDAPDDAPKAPQTGNAGKDMA
ncbi:MAG: hypothetical protein H0T60_19405 [Acidobacteria bacterium]|nr:hypothetical protein [Acidobacteriota bacterium]